MEIGVMVFRFYEGFFANEEYQDLIYLVIDFIWFEVIISLLKFQLMLTLPSGQQINEHQAPQVFLDIVSNADSKIVEQVLELVLKCNNGSIKVSFLNAIASSLSNELVRRQEADSVFQRETIDRNITFIRSVHRQIAEDLVTIFLKS